MTAERRYGHGGRSWCLGAGLGGTLMAYELVPQLRKEDRLTLIGQGTALPFRARPIPGSRSAGASRAGHRGRPRPKSWQRKKIRLLTQGAQRVHPKENRIELNDGSSVAYDYLVIATGPGSRLRRDRRPRAQAATPSRSAMSTTPRRRRRRSRSSARSPGPIVVGAVQGASCFGPAYEFAFILDTELRKRQDARPGADDLRHARSPISAISASTASATPRACSRARCASRHIKWITNAKVTKVEAGKMHGRGGRRGRRARKTRTSCRSPSP